MLSSTVLSRIYIFRGAVGAFLQANTCHKLECSSRAGSQFVRLHHSSLRDGFWTGDNVRTATEQRTYPLQCSCAAELAFAAQHISYYPQNDPAVKDSQCPKIFDPSEGDDCRTADSLSMNTCAL